MEETPIQCYQIVYGLLTNFLDVLYQPTKRTLGGKTGIQEMRVLNKVSSIFEGALEDSKLNSN